MDLSKGETILKEEFETFCMVATNMKEDPTPRVGISTTLEVGHGEEERLEASAYVGI